MMHFYRACVLALLVATSPPAQCFLPVLEGGLGHGEITRDGIEPIAETIQSSERQFAEWAIREIVIANIEEDKIQTPERHFDGDTFRVSSGRLVVLKDEVIKQLVAGDGSGARELLGQALHPLQDYYSHTSHIDRGGPSSTVINPSLGVEKFGHTPAPNGGCSNFFGTTGGPSTSAETSGYYALDGIFPLPGQTYLACSAPTGKCSHGNSIISTFPFNCGLNKDSDARPNHALAFQLATTATTNYVRQVLTLIRFRLPTEQADVAVCRLMGISSPETACAPPVPCGATDTCGGGICLNGFCAMPREGSSCTVDGSSVTGCAEGETCNGVSGMCIAVASGVMLSGLLCPGVQCSIPNGPTTLHPYIFVPFPSYDACLTRFPPQGLGLEVCHDFWGCSYWVGLAQCTDVASETLQQPNFTVRSLPVSQ